MTHNRRKSDKLVVPEKSPNKPNQMGAEGMEGRGLPKENKKQRNMFRTQRREDVLKKLHLIHQKAGADKKMKFTTLMHHIYLDKVTLDKNFFWRESPRDRIAQMGLYYSILAPFALFDPWEL